jgi:hypothetical protein
VARRTRRRSRLPRRPRSRRRDLRTDASSTGAFRTNVGVLRPRRIFPAASFVTLRVHSWTSRVGLWRASRPASSAFICVHLRFQLFSVSFVILAISVLKFFSAGGAGSSISGTGRSFRAERGSIRSPMRVIHVETASGIGRGGRGGYRTDGGERPSWFRSPRTLSAAGGTGTYPLRRRRRFPGLSHPILFCGSGAWRCWRGGRW